MRQLLEEELERFVEKHREFMSKQTQGEERWEIEQF
jgi:hypothetical protein